MAKIQAPFALDGATSPAEAASRPGMRRLFRSGLCWSSQTLTP